MFAYCGNNPAIRIDIDGVAWDTVFDIVSFVASVIEVCINPSDPAAWAGLAGDAFDLVPFVSGCGEIIRGGKVTHQAMKALDDASDAAKAPVVIGETMDRVTRYADEIGADIFNAPFGVEGDELLEANRKWIRQMMEEGRDIIDIGPDFMRRLQKLPSPFYNMERMETKNYEKYFKAFIRGSYK